MSVPSATRHDHQDHVAIGIGDALRGAREEQGRTIEDVARATRVRADYLRALEGEEFGVFGGDVYAKGFLTTYARHLGLDPGPLLESFRRHAQPLDVSPRVLAAAPAATAPRSSPPWLAWTLAGLLVLAGAVGVAGALGSRNPDPADTRTAPVQPVSPTSPAPTDPATTDPTPTVEPTSDQVTVFLAFEDRCWINVTVDGQFVEQGVQAPGTTKTYEGAQQIEIRFGDLGAVRIEVNDEQLGVLGRRGEVRTIAFGRTGIVNEDVESDRRPAPSPSPEPADPA